MTVLIVNLLKPTGHVMHQHFNIQQLYVLPTLYLCLCIYLRTNSDFYPVQHKLIEFYNRDEKCLLRGTNWVFKLLKPTGHVMHQHFNIQQMYVLPTLYLSQNKQRLLPRTA